MAVSVAWALSAELVPSIQIHLPPIAIEGSEKAVVRRSTSVLDLRTLATLLPTESLAIDSREETTNPLVILLSSTLFPPTPRTYEYRVTADQVLLVDSLPPIDAGAIADLDGDGLVEVVGQFSANLYVYEALIPDGAPRTLTWISPSLPNVLGYPIAADTDLDGFMEIIHTENPLSSTAPSFLDIFENVGDNAFGLKLHAQVAPGPTTNKIVGDFDLDGRLEIVTCGLNGIVVDFECVENDNWVRVWEDSTDLFNAYGVAGGSDTDHDGRPEFFITGNHFGSGGVLEDATIVFEASCDDHFERHGGFSLPSPGFGLHADALVEIDGYPPMEVLTIGGSGARVWRPSGIGRWTEVGQVPDSGAANYEVRVADFNHNGRSEVFRGGSLYSSVLELSTGSDALPAPLDRGPFWPASNPCRGECVFYTPISRNCILAIRAYNVAGRLVASWTASPSDGRVTWRPDRLTSGHYIMELLDTQGRKLGRTSITLLR